MAALRSTARECHRAMRDSDRMRGFVFSLVSTVASCSGLPREAAEPPALEVRDVATRSAVPGLLGAVPPAVSYPVMLSFMRELRSDLFS